MKNNRPSFFRQTSVLTSRYFRIFFNDRQSLLLTIIIPLITILIVSVVASGDMFSVKPDIDHSINGGYPILAWQQVDQEKKDEFSFSESGIGTIDDNENPYVYVVFSENEYKNLSNAKFIIKDSSSKEVFSSDSDIKTVDCKNGIYSQYVEIDKELAEGTTYNITYSADVKLKNGKKAKSFENEFSAYVNNQYEDVTDLVTLSGNAYNDFDILDDDFEINDYVANNQQKIASLSNATMQINGDEYVVINDAESLAFILSDKSDVIGFNNEDWYENNYYLNTNIDLNNYDGIIPFGDEDNEYKGIFDGNGHIIRNISINSNSDNVGLFGVVGASIRNLGITDFDISTEGQNAGAIAGRLVNGSIYNCYVTNSTINADDGYVGSIVGYVDSNNDNSTEIYTCYAKDTQISSDGNYIGGLIGDASNIRVSACYAVSDINVGNDSRYVGNVIGNSSDRDSLSNLFYLTDYNNLLAIGDKDASVDYEDTDVKSLSEKSFKECSSLLGHSIDEDDFEYGFKKDGQLDLFGGTQTGLFMLVCVAIFVGICNSIQEICKERNILKREYMTNLRLSSYTLSKLIVQAIICAVQMIIVLLIFSFYIRDKQIYSSGVIFNSVWIEYFITMFLLAFAADTMALVISAVVKNSSTANTFIPIILIVQIVFSGVLFDLGKQMDAFASLMISKWGIAGLAISSRLNDSRVKFLLDSPDFELNLGTSMSSVKDLYISTPKNLLMVWAILLAFIIVCSVLCTLLLTQVKKDRR